jgi:uncharacterized protein (DUF4415 family)
MYEWDEEKRKANIRKHAVDFTALESFVWEDAVVQVDDRDYGEIRYIAFGPIGSRLHCVWFKIREEKIRIIGLKKGQRERGKDMARKLTLSTKAEDGEINRGIARDPGMPEWTEQNFAVARRAKDVLPPALYDALVKERRGRGPQKTPIKKPVTIRVDPDVLKSYKSTGKGWQSRMNEVLRAGAPK